MKHMKERKKAFHAKTRSGCLTCRARRIKYDETRPTCLKCKKSGRECGGLLPSRYCTKELPLAPKIPTASLQPSADMFATEREYLYFSLFSDKIAAELSPYFAGDAWSRMILQACMSEPAIRHAVIAIGALGKMHEATKDGECQIRSAAGCVDVVYLPKKRPKSQKSTPSPTVSLDSFRKTIQDKAHEARFHHEYALEQYDKSIKRMRENALRGQQSLRVTLINCIIIVCFETLHGNNESAIQQLQTGTQLLQDWKFQHPDSEKHPLGYSSPAPGVVDDFLCQTVGRMEIQTMSFRDTRSPEIRRRLKEEGKEVIERMPKQFTSLYEARTYFELISRRVMHFTASTPFKVFPASGIGFITTPNTNTPENKRWTGWGQSWAGTVRSNLPIRKRHGIHPYRCPKSGTMSSNPNHHQLQVTKEDLNAHSECQRLLGELAAWRRSFRPLLEPSIQKRNMDAISALTLHIQQQTCSIFRAAFFTTEMELDVFLPEFRTIVSQVSRLLAIQEEQANKKNISGNPVLAFSFDVGFVLSLYIVAMKCREGKTRRAALRLLRGYPRREGVWDSVVASAVSAWIMGLEGQLEEGADGAVPEERRARKASVDFDLIRRTAEMTCLQMHVETGRFVERTHIHTW